MAVRQQLTCVGWLQMDTRAEGFTAAPLSEDDMTVWEAKLWLSEGTLATDLVQYNARHGYVWPAM